MKVETLGATEAAVLSIVRYVSINQAACVRRVRKILGKASLQEILSAISRLVESGAIIEDDLILSIAENNNLKGRFDRPGEALTGSSRVYR